MNVQTILIFSAALFSLGIYGALTRRNPIAILMSIELMLNAAALNFVTFTKYVAPGRVDGQVFTLFIITIAAAEAAVALAIFVALFKFRREIDVQKADKLKN